MEELPIHTQINSRYRIFDASGQLPFSIVFGLCRRSPSDTDSRTIILNTAGSVLDVPYALGHGLLRLQTEEESTDTKEWIDVDINKLKGVKPKDAGTLALPSPVNRKESKFEAFTVHQCHVSAHDILASILEPGKKYRLQLTGRDLGVKQWVYTEPEELEKEDALHILSQPSESARLVSSKSNAGNATFKVVQSLPWPPKIETKLHLSDTTLLEVTVTNNGSESVTVQMRGQQRFLVPWGPFQPENSPINERGSRIIDPISGPGKNCWEVINSSTGIVVRGKDKPQTGCLGLTSSNVDRRPKIEDTVVLKPGVPLARNLDIRELVEGLEDGQYRLRLKPRGCRWWNGEIGETEDGRVPAHLGAVNIPPLILESTDEVEMHIRGGKRSFQRILYSPGR